MRKQPNRPKRYKTKPKDFAKAIEEGKVMQFYKSPQWIDLRKQALMRDKHECQRCNGKFCPAEQITLSEATEVHHIKGIKEYPELCLHLDNIVSLCHACHDHVEGRWVSNTSIKPQITREMW